MISRRGQQYEQHDGFLYRVSLAFGRVHYICPLCGRVNQSIERTHACRTKHCRAIDTMQKRAERSLRDAPPTFRRHLFEKYRHLPILGIR